MVWLTSNLSVSQNIKIVGLVLPHKVAFLNMLEPACSINEGRV